MVQSADLWPGLPHEKQSLFLARKDFWYDDNLIPLRAMKLSSSTSTSALLISMSTAVSCLWVGLECMSSILDNKWIAESSYVMLNLLSSIS